MRSPRSPALIRRLHEAKASGVASVTTRGAGAPRKLGFVAGAEFVIVGMLFVYAIPLRDAVVFQVGSLAVFVMLLGGVHLVAIAATRAFASRKRRFTLSASNGRSANVSGSNSLRGVAKKSPP